MREAVRKSELARWEQFLDSWSRGFSAPSLLWDGHKAVNELSRKGALDVIRLRGKWRRSWKTRERLEAIARAAHWYRMKADLRSAQEMKAVREFIINERDRIQRQASKVKTPAVANILSLAAEDISLSLRAIAAMKKQELGNPLGIWDRLLPPAKSGRRMEAELDLDNKLQVQLARLLWTILGEYDITRETIARLVRYAYWKLDLAAPFEDALTLRSTGRMLTQKSVENRLERARIFVRAR